MRFFEMIRFSFLFSILLVVSGCDNAEKEKAGAAEKIALTMMTSADNPPYEFLKVENGESAIVGFDVDLVDQLAIHMGVTIEKVNADFSALIPSLLSKRADFIIAGITITEERKKSIDFSTPYLVTKVAVVFRKDGEQLSSTALPGKKLGVQLGSVHDSVIKKIVGDQAPADIVFFNQLGELIQELKSGRLDGAVMDNVPAHFFVKENPELTLQYLEGGDVEYGIAFSKGSPLIEKFNQAIEKLKSSPVYEELQAKWFKKE